MPRTTRYMTRQEWVSRVHQLYQDLTDDVLAEPLNHARRTVIANSFVTVAVELVLLLDAMGGLDTEKAYEMTMLLKRAINLQSQAGTEYLALT